MIEKIGQGMFFVSGWILSNYILSKMMMDLIPSTGEFVFVLIVLNVFFVGLIMYVVGS